MGVPKDETEEQKAIRLAKAKKNASKAREEAMVAKYKDKVLERLKESAPPKTARGKVPADESESEDEDEEAPKKPLKVGGRPKRDEDEASANRPVREEVKEETEKPVKASARRPSRPKAKVIIEQSSDDEDTFEASKDVIFVKRVRAKPKVEQQHAPMPPSDYRSASATNPVTRQEQPLPQRFQQQQQQQQAPPPKPQMSQEKRLEMERYLNMTRGNFLPISRPR
jgi:hypothetical protein